MSEQLKELEVPGVETLPNMAQVSVFIKGTDVFGKIRTNREIELVTTGGNRVKGNVTNVAVGPMIDLMSMHGGFNVQTYGRPYSPLGFLQAYGDAVGENPIDVTQLYTVVVVSIANNTALPMPGSAGYVPTPSA